MLARSGDIQPNPGPSTKCINRNINRSNKISAKICDQCLTVTRFRHYSCGGCGELGMPVCPYCVTLNVINNQSESNDIREYNCNVCIRNSNSSASVTVINASNNYVSTPVECVNIHCVHR